MNAPTLHCPDCTQVLIKDILFTGYLDVAKTRVEWKQKCPHCGSIVHVEIAPALKATGNGSPATLGEKREPRIRSFHS